MATRVGRLLRRFAIARSGAAAVEFAIIVPFLITLYMGSIEISDLIAVDRRVTVISGTAGDLVARTDGDLASATLADYFKASEGIILPYSKTGLKQVVTCVKINSDRTTKVMWSQAYNGGTAATVNSSYAIPSAMIDISLGQYVIVSKTDYSYKPLLGFVVKTAINLHRESYYLPRYGQYIALT